MIDPAVSWLMFFTLGAGVVVAGGAFAYFLTSRRNREVTEASLVGAGPRAARNDSGALPDLLGVGLFALIAMALLLIGYAYS